MIAGIGVDLVRLDRMEPWMADPEKMKRVFGEKELADIQAGVSGRRERAAARFAAKEALGKAFGTGLKGCRLTEIQVVHDPNGRPMYELSGAMLNRLQQTGGTLLLSLAHEHDYAIAVAVLECK